MLMLKVSLSILLFFTLTTCEPPVTSYGVPFNNNNNFGPSNSYGVPNNNFGGNNGYPSGVYPPSNGHGSSHHDDGHDNSEPKSYEFGYAVKDDYTGNDYKRRESSDGNQVNGEYRVQLPDGRTQIVTYYADWQSGFHADVRYEGTANYPEDYKTGNHQNGGYQNGGHQGGYQNGGHQNGGHQNGYPSGPSNQYGAPFGGNQPSNQYGAPFNGGNGGFGKATSSVTIKDFSGPGTPYNPNPSGYGGGYGNGHESHTDISHGNNYDSYANAGNFGNRQKPSTAYGAP